MHGKIGASVNTSYKSVMKFCTEISKCKVIAIANRKGGTRKATSTVNLGIGLPVTLPILMERAICNHPIKKLQEGILHHEILSRRAEKGI